MLIGESMIFIHTFSTIVHEMCIELNLPKSFFVWLQILYYSPIEIISIIVICYTLHQCKFRWNEIPLQKVWFKQNPER